MNESVIANTTNQTAMWEIKDITDLQFLFAEGQRITSELLISWDMIPEDIYFRVSVILLCVVVACFLLIKGGNLINKSLQTILLAALVIFILIALGLL